MELRAAERPSGSLLGGMKRQDPVVLILSLSVALSLLLFVVYPLGRVAIESVFSSRRLV